MDAPERIYQEEEQAGHPEKHIFTLVLLRWEPLALGPLFFTPEHTPGLRRETARRVCARVTGASFPF